MQSSISISHLLHEAALRWKTQIDLVKAFVLIFTPLEIPLLTPFDFISNGVQAGTFSESFETYNLGKLGGQGNWTNYVEEYGFIVNNDRASEGVQSIISHPTSTDLIASSMLDWATTTGIGILSVDFLVEKKPNWAMVEFCYGWLVCVDIEIGNDTLESTKIILSNEVGGEDIILADNYFNNVFHDVFLLWLIQ